MGSSLDLKFSLEFDFRCGIGYDDLQNALQVQQRPLTLDDVQHSDLIREHITSALGVSGINFRSSELEEIENDKLWTVTVISPEIDLTTFDQEYELGKDNGRLLEFLQRSRRSNWLTEVQADSALALKRCFMITSPRFSIPDVDACKAELQRLLTGLPGKRKPGVVFWASSSCKFKIIVEVAPSPLAFSLHQHLMAIWGTYERDIEKRVHVINRHPHSDSVISMRFGDGERLFSDDTKAARAAYVDNVYATTNFAELGRLVSSPLSRKGDRKVNMLGWSETNAQDSKRILTFGEQWLDDEYADVAASISLTLGIVHFAQQLTFEGLSFDTSGEIDIEDLLDLPELGEDDIHHLRERVVVYKEWDRYEGSSGRILIDTSQGGKYDKPPKEWIRSEVVQFQALETKNVRAPDLLAPIHPLFARQNWMNLSDEEYAAVDQALMLATLLLEVAGPYLASFLPNVDEAQMRDSCVLINEDASAQQIQDAREDLLKMAGHIKFEKNDKMVTVSGQFGLNHLGTAHNRATNVIGAEDSGRVRGAERRDRQKGLPRRGIRVAIATELLDAILHSEIGSERHLIASFYFGVVLTHELGHTIFLQNWNNPYYDAYVGDDIIRELGNSLIGWLFGSWTPQSIRFGNDERSMQTIKNGLCWQKQIRRPIRKQVATTNYSLPVAHIQRMMTMSEWKKFDLINRPLEVRQQLLIPKTPFRVGQHARTSRDVGLRWYMASLGEFEEEYDWSVSPARELPTDQMYYIDFDWEGPAEGEKEEEEKEKREKAEKERREREEQSRGKEKEEREKREKQWKEWEDEEEREKEKKEKKEREELEKEKMERAEWEKEKEKTEEGEENLIDEEDDEDENETLFDDGAYD